MSGNADTGAQLTESQAELYPDIVTQILFWMGLLVHLFIYFKYRADEVTKTKLTQIKGCNLQLQTTEQS